MTRFALLLSTCLALPWPGPFRADPQSSAPRDVDLHGPEIAIPFAIEGSRPIPVVEAMVNGRGPFRFYFDTGASGCVVDSGFAREIELEHLGKIQVGDPSPTGSIEADRVRIPHLAIGDAEWLDLPAVAFDRSRFGAAEGVKGVLGLPLSAEHLLTVDYSAGVLRISDESLPERGDGIVELLGEGPLPEVEITVAGRPIRSHLDTGSPSGFTLPKAFAADLKWKTEPVVVGRGGTVASQFDIVRGELDGTVVLAGRSFTDPQVHVNDRFPTANIGREVLREFVFSIDQRNRRARFLPAPSVRAAEGSPAPKRRLGIHLQPSGDFVTIVSVDSASVAEKAGLRAGDVIVSVDGRPLFRGDLSPLQGAVEGRAPIELVIRRAGRDQAIAIPGVPPEEPPRERGSRAPS